MRERERERERERRGAKERMGVSVCMPHEVSDAHLSRFADTHNPRPLWILFECDANTVVGQIALQIQALIDPLWFGGDSIVGNVQIC
jgi:hypothetical protein